MITAEKSQWPARYDLLGVRVSATDYDEAVETIVGAALRRESAVVSLHAVHAIVTASRTPALREAVNRFEMIAPDGQPVRWALNRLHNLHLKDRVYGPELTLRLCARAAELGIPVYLYGSTQYVIDVLCRKLPERFPGLTVAGAESPPFRDLTLDEDDAAVERINRSGAGIVFLGLGAPKQDLFAHEHRERVRAVQVCVGAAFDFHAGTLAMAPAWMQRTGLEWLYRLAREPRRLWQRYLVTNTAFLWKLGVELTCRRYAALFRRSRPQT